MQAEIFNNTVPARMRQVTVRISLVAVLCSLWKNRNFAFSMALRDARSLYRGAFLGATWLVSRPLIQSLVYVVVIGMVLSTRPSEFLTTTQYVAYVLVGMGVWDFLTRSLQMSSRLLLDKADVVKQLNFPIEILPLISMLNVSIGAIVSILMGVAIFIFTNWIHVEIVFLPLALFITAITMVGFSWICMFVGAVVRDLGEFIGVMLALGVFFSPVFLTPSMAGEWLWLMVLLNPLSHFVIIARDTAFGQFHPWSWLVASTMAGASVLVGGWIVSRARIKINEFV